MRVKARSIRAAAAAVLILTPLSAFAHAHLDHTSPAVGSTVAKPPKEVIIWFTEALEPRFSSIEVRDTKGASVIDGKAALDPSNSAELRVPLKALPSGTYTVTWRVLSVDTHRTQGSFTFSIAP
jgi:methionine-rich copper-binding protein CopC